MFDGLIALEEDFDVPATARGPAPPSEITVEDPKEAISLVDATPQELLDAQARTTSWLDEIGAYTGDPEGPDQRLDDAAREAARAAFTSLTDPYRDPLDQKSRLMVLSTPVAVRHLAGMLSQYDWEFVKQAKEIRGYIVARLIEHAKSPDAKISLSALRTLGTVTEIGAYTERMEIVRPPAEATPSALADALRAKLKGLMPRQLPLPVEDAQVIENGDGGA